MAYTDYKKGLWYGSVNLDNIITENVQNIRQSHNLLHRSHEKVKLAAWGNFLTEIKKSREASSKETSSSQNYLQ